MKINFDKVRNYNQFLIAIAGTVAVLFIVIGAFFILYEEISSSFQDDYNIGILASEETNILQKDSLRKQIISFSELSIIDSAKQLYLLPVTQADLLEYEHSRELLGLINTYKEGKFSSSYGFDNNLVVCDLIKEESKIIFDTRVSIANYFNYENNGKKFLIIKASEVDTNNDKYLNSDDLQALYVYDLQLQELFKIKLKENFTALKVYSPNRSGELIGQFGVDRDRDGQFLYNREPSIFYKIDINEKKLISFIKDNQIEELQQQLEGKK